MDPIFIKPKASDDTGISDFSMEHLKRPQIFLSDLYHYLNSTWISNVKKSIESKITTY